MYMLLNYYKIIKIRVPFNTENILFNFAKFSIKTKSKKESDCQKIFFIHTSTFSHNNHQPNDVFVLFFSYVDLLTFEFESNDANRNKTATNRIFEIFFRKQSGEGLGCVTRIT